MNEQLYVGAIPVRVVEPDRCECGRVRIEIKEGLADGRVRWRYLANYFLVRRYSVVDAGQVPEGGPFVSLSVGVKGRQVSVAEVRAVLQSDPTFDMGGRRY